MPVENTQFIVKLCGDLFFFNFSASLYNALMVQYISSNSMEVALKLLIILSFLLEHNLELLPSTNADFVHKILNMKITPFENKMTQYYGIYDGYVRMLNFLNNNNDIAIDSKEMVTRLTKLLILFGKSGNQNVSISSLFDRSLYLSFNEVCTLTQMLCSTLTKSPFTVYAKIPEEVLPQCVGVLCKLLQLGDMTTLGTSKDFEDLQISIIKIFIVPFVVDLDNSVLYSIMTQFYENNVLEYLLQIVKHTKHCEIVVGLITRLVLTGEMMLGQLKTLFHKEEYFQTIQLLIMREADEPILCDLLAFVTHYLRYSVEDNGLVVKFFQSSKGMWVWWISQ